MNKKKSRYLFFNSFKALKTGIIIQARVGSTRLPWKVVLPFEDTLSMIEIILERLISYSGGMEIVLATSTSVEDEVLCRVAANMGIECFRGPEQDVLGRFIQAAEMHSFDNIVRICADNPFLDVKATLDLLDFLAGEDYNYLAYRIAGGTPSIKSHLGLWGEVVSLESLKKVKKLTNEKIYYEHVTNFIYGHPDMFKIKWVDAPELVYRRTDIRLTLDDETDFNLCRDIYREMKEEGSAFDLENIVRFLDRNKHFLAIMKDQISKYSK